MSSFLFILVHIQGSPFLRSSPNRSGGEDVSSFPHLLLFLNPAITGLAYCAFRQGRVLPVNPDSSSSLSLAGLAGQSMMHFILAFKWITEATIPWENVFSGSLPLPGMWFFYNFFVWGFVDNMVLAVVNWRLYRTAQKERKMNAICDDREKGRDEPLLGPV